MSNKTKRDDPSQAESLILTLGRHLAVLAESYDKWCALAERLDDDDRLSDELRRKAFAEISPEHDRRCAAMVAIEGVIATTTAETLPEAAIQVMIAASYPEAVAQGNEDPEKVVKWMEGLLRSAMPAIVSVAGIDLDEYGGRYFGSWMQGQAHDIAEMAAEEPKRVGGRGADCASRLGALPEKAPKKGFLCQPT